MSSRRAERLVNLVICLLSTRQFLTAARIRATVPGYEPDDGSDRADEAFKRMFERDKAELRELGVPLETGRTSVFDTEDGYRIARRDYELPEVPLEPDEAAAVGLAARLWQSAELADAARGALLKLRAGGVDVDAGPRPWTLRAPAGRRGAGAAPLPGRGRRPAGRCRFGYRKPDGDAPADREVQPWGVVSWRGRWYLVGHDLGRDATRCFRLSRVVGAVAADRPGRRVQAADRARPGRARGRGRAGGARDGRPVRVRRGSGTWLRRIAARVRPGAPDDDWDVVELGYHRPGVARRPGRPGRADGRGRATRRRSATR